MWKYDRQYSDLYHHGVLGMKWGQRNGPPYPLSAEKHSASEKKAGWKKSLGGGRNEHMYGRNGLKAGNEPKKKEKPAKLRKLKYEKDAERGAAIAKTALVAIAAAYGAAHALKNDDADNAWKYALTYAGVTSMMLVGLEIKSNISYKIDSKTEPVDLKTVPRISGKHSAETDQKAVNPNYKNGMQYQMNCVLCTTTYEMRRRGYDVTANVTRQGRKPKDAAAYFNIKNEDFHDAASYQALKDELTAMPNGARGNICTRVGDFGSLHSMVWEKVGNKIIIRDCQTNTTYTDIDASIINQDSNVYAYFRTDNAEINESRIGDAIWYPGRSVKGR